MERGGGWGEGEEGRNGREWMGGKGKKEEKKGREKGKIIVIYFYYKYQYFPQNHVYINFRNLLKAHRGWLLVQRYQRVPEHWKT